MSKNDEKVIEFVCNYDKKSVAEKVRELFKTRKEEILNEQS